MTGENAIEKLTEKYGLDHVLALVLQVTYNQARNAATLGDDEAANVFRTVAEKVSDALNSFGE